jgi:predicted enzyme related to lactoylglutathione lyase
MKIKLSRVYVNNQDKALKFYTEILGFVKKSDVSNGGYRWLTVVSPEEPNGTEVHLELNQNPAAKTYQEAIFKQGIPATPFFVEDIQKEYEKLKGLGIEFTMQPTKVTGSTIAVFNDMCGNLIQINQMDH